MYQCVCAKNQTLSICFFFPPEIMSMGQIAQRREDQDNSESANISRIVANAKKRTNSGLSAL